MGVALAAIADDGDLLALDQIDVGVAIVIDAHGDSLLQVSMRTIIRARRLVLMHEAHAIRSEIRTPAYAANLKVNGISRSGRNLGTEPRRSMLPPL